MVTTTFRLLTPICRYPPTPTCAVEPRETYLPFLHDAGHAAICTITVDAMRNRRINLRLTVAQKSVRPPERTWRPH
eukprot:4157004-Prymnesium_polylepis.1